VIGDVHGCYDELAELLAKLGHADLLDPDIPPAAPESFPRVIFVGDIVDRGPKIMQSMALVYRLCKRGHALSVVGNHDDRFLRWLLRKPVHIRHGLEQTVKEFEAMTSAQKKWWREELTAFIRALPWAIRIDEGRAIIAHASWHAALADSPSTDQLRTATLYGPTTGRKTAEGYPERIDWAPGYEGPELVIFGHQVYDVPYMHDYAIGIDTGCVFGGALTALRYPGLEIVSVKSRGDWRKRVDN
jgi:protein phosphatase